MSSARTLVAGRVAPSRTLVVGRFAPSPTGDLHLGSAFVAVVAWLRARARGGRFVVRMEDLDPPRVVVGAAERIIEDLRWLGLDWDVGPGCGPDASFRQSARTALYQAALERLARAGGTYPCTCSRAELRRIASAPHLEDGVELRYPGTCRDGSGLRAGRAAAVRLAVASDAVVSFVDLGAGPQTEHVAQRTGDFVLKRADGVFSYQLAVVVDDLDMGVTEIVRGADLLGSTARQIVLGQMLAQDYRQPDYLHVPLVLGPDGERLAKRHAARWHGSTLAELRQRGKAADAIVGEIVRCLGIGDGAPRSLTAALEPARQLLAEGAGLVPTPWILPSGWLMPS